MIELDYITVFYGKEKAARSGVPLINHIHDGLAVMREIGASDFAQRAYCLHPLYQADESLAKGYLQSLPGVPIQVVLLAMEYRNQANAWLSDKVKDESVYSYSDPKPRRVVEMYRTIDQPTPGPLTEVRHMLIADKVQNYKDFRTYHLGKHPRTKELEIYFETWLEVLGIDGHEFDRLCAVIDEDRQIRFVQLP
jgi:hypothetical protein